MEKTWSVYATFGPLGTTWRNYRVIFAKEGILMIPAGVFTTLSASPAFSGALTGFLAGLEKRQADSGTLNDDGNIKWKRYYLDSIEKITVKHSIFANEVIIKSKNQKGDTYGVLVRSQTDIIRKTAKDLYSNLYEEIGFKRDV